MTTVSIDTSPLPNVTLNFGEVRTDMVMVSNREDFPLYSIIASSTSEYMTLCLSMDGAYTNKILLGNLEPRSSLPIYVRRYAQSPGGIYTAQICLEGELLAPVVPDLGPSDEDMEYVMRSLGVVPKKRLSGLARIRRAVRPSAHDR